MLRTARHFLDQFKSRLILQWIKVTSRVIQNLLRYFNSTIISTSFVPLPPVLPVIFCLVLNELVVALFALKSTIVLLAGGFKSG